MIYDPENDARARALYREIRTGEELALRVLTGPQMYARLFPAGTYATGPYVPWKPTVRNRARAAAYRLRSWSKGVAWAVREHRAFPFSARGRTVRMYGAELGFPRGPQWW